MTLSLPPAENFINGKLTPSGGGLLADVYNPSTGKVIAQATLSAAEDVDAAIQAASSALPRWAETPVVERARVLFRYREILERRVEELAQLITREHGKTLAESRAEVRRGIEVVEFACGIPSLIMGQSLNDIASRVDSTVDRHPVGVCVGVTPYNFPAMAPMWMFPIALACGNSFILKPSEKTPLSAVRLAQWLDEAGCPPGVFNVLQGDGECVGRLLDDPRVAAVSFVGSSPVAREIYRRGGAAGKRVQAAGGAKNYCVIMPDADLDLAVQALAAASFGCGGQRCMATSVAVPVGEIAEPLLARLVDHAGSLLAGRTDDEGTVDLGPLIRAAHVDRVASYLDLAADEGASIAVDGRNYKVEGAGQDGFFLGPCVVDHVKPEMRLAREEIFGPVLSVLRADTLAEAIQAGSRSEYGNGASIFTRDGHAARTFREQFNAGMIGVNVGVPAPMAWFPFTGWNGSFFGDLHVQGREGVAFYTRQKVTLTRWFEPAGDCPDDPIWSSEATPNG